ncbi:MAG: sigma-70 family RNA polymerase sigma factor [Anaerolineae bacterium]|nr:sigma-70 family RNA polymerase sigma factor [Anaerolineae bacterium]
MTERTNEQWLADLGGDPQSQETALSDLRERLQRGIFYYLSRERSDLADLSHQEIGQMAEDLAQDATLRVMENMNSFRGDSRFTTWATKIAVRVAISDLRRARYKDFSLENLTADGEIQPFTTDMTGGSFPPGPEDSTERSDVMTKVSQALEEALTSRQRQALMAVALQGVPLEIVAEQMNTNRNALYKLLHDARRKLRSHLEAQGLSTEYMLKLFES